MRNVHSIYETNRIRRRPACHMVPPQLSSACSCRTGLYRSAGVLLAGPEALFIRPVERSDPMANSSPCRASGPRRVDLKAPFHLCNGRFRHGLDVTNGCAINQHVRPSEPRQRRVAILVQPASLVTLCCRKRAASLNSAEIGAPSWMSVITTWAPGDEKPCSRLPYLTCCARVDSSLSFRTLHSDLRPLFTPVASQPARWRSWPVQSGRT